MPRDSLLWAYSLLILWLPLPVGSNRVVSAAFFELAVFSLMLIWCVQYWRRLRSLPSLFTYAKPIFIVWLLLIGLIILQITPLPFSWVEWLSPQSAVLKLLAYDDITPSWGMLSVDPHSTMLALQRTTAYLIFFILTLLLVRNSSHYRWLAVVLLTSGCFQALYGSLMVLSGLEYGFIFEKIYYRNVATGTFINRNNFANYLVITAAVGVGLLLSKTSVDVKQTLLEKLRSMVNWLMSGNIWIRFALIIIATGIVLSRSRMGNVAFISSLIISGFLFLWLKRYLTKGTLFLIISILVIDLLIVGSLVGVDRVVERVQSTSLEAEHRDEAVEDTLRYWRDFPLIGSGGGSYYTTFPRYKDGIVGLYYDHAHNDYLEIASEYGLFGPLLLALIPILTLWKLIPIYQKTDDGPIKGISFTLMMATLALFTHAIVDFNFQIPANAATYVVILALGWVACGRYWRRHLHATYQTRLYTGSRSAKIALAGISITILGLGAWVTCIGIADYHTEQSKYQIALWNKEKTIDTQKWRQLLENQKQAVSLDPANHTALLNLARLWQWHETVKNISIEQRDQTNEKIASLLQQSIQANPGFAPGWLALARLQEKRTRFGPTFLNALKMADMVAPWEIRIQLAIIDVGLKNWSRLPNEHKELILAAISRSMSLGQVQPVIKLIRTHRYERLICRTLKNPKPIPSCHQYLQ